MRNNTRLGIVGTVAFLASLSAGVAKNVIDLRTGSDTLEEHILQRSGINADLAYAASILCEPNREDPTKYDCMDVVGDLKERADVLTRKVALDYGIEDANCSVEVKNYGKPTAVSKCEGRATKRTGSILKAEELLRDYNGVSVVFGGRE